MNKIVKQEDEGIKIFTVHKRIIALKKQGMATFLELAVCLKSVRDNELYKKMDYETFEAYIGSPELGFERGVVYKLIAIYEKFCKEFNVSPGTLMKIYWTKLREILPIVDKDNYEDWLDKAEHLSRSDLIEEIKETKRLPVLPLPEGKYNVIYADPAWEYDRTIGQGVAIEQYELMPLEKIKDLKVNDLAAEDCLLFLWATFPKLIEALEVIKAWGFEYKTVAFTWVKTNKNNDKPFFGIGSYFKSNAEVCLLATKGEPHKFVKDNSISSIIMSPLREHSRKPDEAREMIDRLVGDIPKIELFSRKKYVNWDNWGNQTERF